MRVLGPAEEGKAGLTPRPPPLFRGKEAGGRMPGPGFLPAAPGPPTTPVNECGDVSSPRSLPPGLSPSCPAPPAPHQHARPARPSPLPSLRDAASPEPLAAGAGVRSRPRGHPRNSPVQGCGSGTRPRRLLGGRDAATFSHRWAAEWAASGHRPARHSRNSLEAGLPARPRGSSRDTCGDPRRVRRPPLPQLPASGGCAQVARLLTTS